MERFCDKEKPSISNSTNGNFVIASFTSAFICTSHIKYKLKLIYNCFFLDKYL